MRLTDTASPLRYSDRQRGQFRVPTCSSFIVSPVELCSMRYGGATATRPREPSRRCTLASMNTKAHVAVGFELTVVQERGSLRNGISWSTKFQKKATLIAAPLQSRSPGNAPDRTRCKSVHRQIPRSSLIAAAIRWPSPRYRSVVRMEAWPRNSFISLRSLPRFLQSLADVRRRS